MINRDAFNEILAQLKDDQRLAKAFQAETPATEYYEISAEARDLVGKSLRKRLAVIPDTDLAAIRNCIRALRNIYHC